MRILLVTESFPTPTHPGRGIFIYEQVEALSEDHVVDVLFPQPRLPGVPTRWLEPTAGSIHPGAHYVAPDRARLCRPTYLHVPRNKAVRTSQLAGVIGEALRAGAEPFDLVHAHWLFPAGAAAVRAGKAAGVPVVVTAHAGDVYRDLGKPRHRKLVDEVLQGATHVVAVAEYFRRPLLERGLAPERLTVIPNGVDTGVFRLQDRKAVRVRLGLPVERPVLLYIGNLEPAKGVLDVVDAHSSMPDSAPVLVIAGTGSLSDRLSEAARASNGRVVLRGWQQHSAVALYLAAADAFVLFSRAEGNPVTALESLCCGTPVIGSAIPALMPIVTEGVNGWLVGAGRPMSLRDSMAAASIKEWDRSRIATEAASRYGWGAVTARLNAIYESAVGVSSR